MLATPPGPRYGPGPAGSDVLGLYFIGVCVIIGGTMQIILGLPMNLLVSRIRSLSLRLTACALAGLIPVALSIPIIMDTPSTFFDAALTLGTVTTTFGTGSWVIFSQLSPET